MLNVLPSYTMSSLSRFLPSLTEITSAVGFGVCTIQYFLGVLFGEG